MKELAQIRAAVMNALKEEGLETVERFPAERVRAYAGAVAAVGVGTVRSDAAGFCHYLGEMTDPETQTVRERYGKELQGEITIEVRAAEAAECESGCERAAEALLRGLPEGIRTGALRWQENSWEKSTGMFLRRGILECSALFLAESEAESGAFLDFRLKGVLT